MLRITLEPSRVVLVVKNLPANAEDARDAGSTPGSGRSPGRGHGNTPVFLPGNPMDRGAWNTRVAQSDTTEAT